MAIDNTEILNFTWLDDENYSLWVVHMEVDLVCCSVAMVMIDVFKTNEINSLTKFAKIISAADTYA